MKRLTVTTMLIFLVIAAPLAVSAQENGDVNCDDALNILDIVYLINNIYKSGPDPCEFVSPGVSFIHYDNRVVDVTYTYSNIAQLWFYAPEDGWVDVNFSLYVNTSTSCLMYQLRNEIPREDEPERTTSVIMQFSPDSPLTWSQIFEVSEGYNTIWLDVSSCVRDGERANVTFSNVNMSANYFPEDYTVIPR